MTSLTFRVRLLDFRGDKSWLGWYVGTTHIVLHIKAILSEWTGFSVQNDKWRDYLEFPTVNQELVLHAPRRRRYSRGRYRASLWHGEWTNSGPTTSTKMQQPPYSTVMFSNSCCYILRRAGEEDDDDDDDVPMMDTGRSKFIVEMKWKTGWWTTKTRGQIPKVLDVIDGVVKYSFSSLVE